MKKIVVIIFMFAGFTVFAQGDNVIDVNGKKQGEWKKYHENGMLRYVGNFKNDKPIGEFKYYYDTGTLQAKMKHLETTSYSVAYYKAGEVKAVGKYINKKRDSTWTYYDEDGHKKATENYSKGLKDKMWYTYFKNGKIAEEKEYEDDFENGIWNMYEQDGKKKMTATHKAGGLEGKAVYYRFGKRQVTGFYYHGLRNGVWIYFKADGTTILKKEEYKNGRRTDSNKDENIEKEPLKPISEDFLNPDVIMQQMGGGY